MPNNRKILDDKIADLKGPVPFLAGQTWGLLYVPGNERFARILSCVVAVMCEMAVLYFVLLIVKHWVPGRRDRFCVFGRFIGVLLSLVIAAPIFTSTFINYFPVDPEATSAVHIVFIILSFVLVFSIYSQS